MTRKEREAQREAAREEKRERFAWAVAVYRLHRLTLDSLKRPSRPPTDAEVARATGVNAKTIGRWKHSDRWRAAVLPVDAEATRIWREYFDREEEEREARRPKVLYLIPSDAL